MEINGCIEVKSDEENWKKFLLEKTIKSLLI